MWRLPYLFKLGVQIQSTMKKKEELHSPMEPPVDNWQNSNKPSNTGQSSPTLTNNKQYKSWFNFVRYSNQWLLLITLFTIPWKTWPQAKILLDIIRSKHRGVDDLKSQKKNSSSKDIQKVIWIFHFDLTTINVLQPTMNLTQTISASIVNFRSMKGN